MGSQGTELSLTEALFGATNQTHGGGGASGGGSGVSTVASSQVSTHSVGGIQTKGLQQPGQQQMQGMLGQAIENKKLLGKLNYPISPSGVSDSGVTDFFGSKFKLVND